MKKIILTGFLALLTAASLWIWRTGSPGTEPGPEDIAFAAEARPADPELAAIYERSCIACHSTPDAQAPLTGHAPSWASRLAQRGDNGLLTSALAGYGNMPAMGMCADCSAQQMQGLIAFMSGESQ